MVSHSWAKTSTYGGLTLITSDGRQTHPWTLLQCLPPELSRLFHQNASTLDCGLLTVRLSRPGNRSYGSCVAEIANLYRVPSSIISPGGVNNNNNNGLPSARPPIPLARVGTNQWSLDIRPICCLCTWYVKRQHMDVTVREAALLCQARREVCDELP